MAMSRRLEDAEQQAVIDWAAYQRLPCGRRMSSRLFMIPNGAHLAGNLEQRAKQVAKMKRLGFRNGVSDLFLAYPSNGLCGLFCEMKKPAAAFPGSAAVKRAYSHEQRRFHQDVEDHYATAVCFGSAEAIKAITDYLSPPDRARAVITELEQRFGSAA